MAIKLLTYNIHKGKSFFTRKSTIPEISRLIDDNGFDIVFLQEVRNFHHKEWSRSSKGQLDHLSQNHRHSYGPNFFSKKSHHGNAILTNYPVLIEKNFNLSVNKIEKRGLLYNQVLIDNQPVHAFCTHLNLRKKHRLLQIDKILSFLPKDAKSKIILAGDFNDFDGSISKILLSHGFQTIVRHTYPAPLPVFSIDSIYVKNIHISSTRIIFNNKTALSSDHLPLLARIKV